MMNLIFHFIFYFFHKLSSILLVLKTTDIDVDIVIENYIIIKLLDYYRSANC